MTETEYLKKMITSAGGDASALPDNLITTHYEALCDALNNSGGGGTGGGGVQADWSENDENSGAYVKNRPFYSEEKEVVVVSADNEFMFVEEMGAYVNVDVDVTTVIEGAEYYIQWNNTTYTCYPFSFDNYLVMGNLGAMSGDESQMTDEPFIIMVDPTNTEFSMAVISVDGWNVDGLLITGKATYVKKLDSIYIPDSYGVPNYIDLVELGLPPINTTSSVSVDISPFQFNEYEKALLNGAVKLGFKFGGKFADVFSDTPASNSSMEDLIISYANVSTTEILSENSNGRVEAYCVETVFHEYILYFHISRTAIKAIAKPLGWL